VLTIAAARSRTGAVAAAVPESAVLDLDESEDGSILSENASQIADAASRSDAVLIGPGLDDIEQSQLLLDGLVAQLQTVPAFVLDAYAIGGLATIGYTPEPLRGRVILTPNKEEAARLLGRKAARSPDIATDVREIASRYNAVVSCYGHVAEPSGLHWTIDTGHVGLGTSGSGDVLAGAVAGLAARGADPAQAACWATYLHAAAGDRLAARVGALGFLARELLDEIPRVLTELQTG
jgi:hydroxyethylthiazole kinase-like uncharacterized protein yjeF